MGAEPPPPQLMVDDGGSKGPKRTFGSCKGPGEGGAGDPPPPPKRQKKGAKEPLENRVILAPRAGRPMNIKEMMTAMGVGGSKVAKVQNSDQSLSQPTVKRLDVRASRATKGEVEVQLRGKVPKWDHSKGMRGYKREPNTTEQHLRPTTKPSSTELSIRLSTEEDLSQDQQNLHQNLQHRPKSKAMEKRS